MRKSTLSKGPRGTSAFSASQLNQKKHLFKVLKLYREGLLQRAKLNGTTEGFLLYNIMDFKAKK